MNLYVHATEEEFYYITNTSDKRDPNALASAIYNKSYEKIGWDYLSISAYEKNDSKYENYRKAHAMGYLEGILTKDRIYSHYTNFYNYFLSDYQNEPQALDAFYNFLLKNIDYIKASAMDYGHKLSDDLEPYWFHLYYLTGQIKGLYEGYNKVAEKEKQLEYKQILLLSYSSEAMDIANSIFRKMRPNFEAMTEKELERYSILNSHCSAFVKLANDFSDIWFGHNTWNYYVLMIRIFKEYSFMANDGIEKSKTCAFSSYPGALSSIDEFYYLDSNLTVMGTSLNILNNSLYDLINVKSVPNWMRQRVANKLASNAQEWIEIYKRENSGTNNGQYMILDINKIDLKNKKIELNALMIVEQMPKYTEWDDVTYNLRKGYWPSYNVPYSVKIYKGLGYPVGKNEKGIFENIKYTQSPRAKIFKRDQGTVNSQEAFKKFMRYNDYKNDNLTENDPSNTIAARGDLDDEYKSCHGAIDVKFVSIKELLERNNIIHMISGPSNEQQPTFSGKTTTCENNQKKLSYFGQNEVWNFPWVDYKLQLFEQKYNNNEKGLDTYIYLIIFGSIFIIAVIVVIIIIIVKKRKNKDIDINKVSFNNSGLGFKKELEEKILKK